MRLNVVTIIVSCWCGLRAFGAPGEPAVAELLSAYQASLEPLNRCAMRVVSEEMVGAAGQSPAWRVVVAESVRYGERAACDLRRYVLPGAPWPLARAQEEWASQFWTVDGKLLELQRSASRPTSVLYVRDTVAKDEVDSWQGTILSGYFPGM